MNEKSFSNKSAIVHSSDRPHVRGKFIYFGAEKFHIKGVTYGTFKPDEDGYQFPARDIVEEDFRLMSANGINSVRTYTVPPRYLLDLAIKYALKIMVGLPWEQHINFLDDAKRKKDILARVKQGVLKCDKHPAILCYTIGNEIPAPIVRWYGREKISGFLHDLYCEVKSADPERLVTYVNYPTTGYLYLDFLDFYSFNVYLESPEKLGAYISRLHNLCGDMPLVLAEIGLDSLRNGDEKQAATLAWQIKTIFSKGCAGMFVFAWTDEWWRGGHEITDWDFGIVDRQRRAKTALPVVRRAMEDAPFAEGRKVISVSVIVCSYNGSPTIRDCIEGLIDMNYPQYEIIVVNDGSTDNLADIVRQYPVKLINTENRGLSNARNTGLQHASGEIVAYIDDDAYPDPDWLHYLSYEFEHSSHAAVGGPNLVPPEDGPIAKCVASSPGGPVHVLLSDETAEHIPGCNMAFRRKLLLAVGGFDPMYQAAGDDVDVCWRIQHAGYTIGFHPSAIVWHHRRNSVKAYWKQQKGYGKAEALLEAKWPEKYNALGHYAWAGSIYGNGNTRPLRMKKERVFYGRWGSALFQSVYQPSGGFLSSIPLMPEWYLICASLTVAGLAGIIWPIFMYAWIVLAISLFIVIAQAYASAKKNVSRQRSLINNWQHRWLTTLLHIIQPAARLYGRLKHGLTPWRKRGAGIRFKLLWSRRIATLWSEEWHANEEWLALIERNLKTFRSRVKRGGDFDSWDLHSRNDLFVTVRSTLLVEEHGGGKQLLRLKHRTKISSYALLPPVCLLLLSTAAFINGAVVASILLLVCCLAFVVRIMAGIASSRFTVYSAFKLLHTEMNKLKKAEVDMYHQHRDRRTKTLSMFEEVPMHNN